MNILITNDDGIYSPGLAALAKVSAKFGSVNVVAPDVERSSASHAISSHMPISIKNAKLALGENIQTFKVNGTPADCAALGTHLNKTDVVLSGINMGPNLGNAMWHSGTLAAAKQAVLLGTRGIALSTPVNKEPDFDALEPFVEDVLKLLLADERLALYNVNFPHKPKGVLWTRQSNRLYDNQIVPGVDPMGRKHYWFTVIPLEPAEEGTDRWAVENDYVSITPLRLDLTDEAELQRRLKKEDG